MQLRTLVACSVLVAAPPAAARDRVVVEPAPEVVDAGEPSIEELELRAQQAFAEGRYDEVVELAAAAYEKTGEIRHLYAQAHAERFRGHCEDALALYARVMAAEPDGVLGQHAREGIKLCEQELDRPPPPAIPAAEVTKTPAPTLPPPSDARKRRPDVLGSVLLALGVAGLAGGASLAVLAASHARKLENAEDEQTIVDEQRKARAFEGAAIAVSVVGTGLVIGGIVRLVLRARKHRHR